MRVRSVPKVDGWLSSEEGQREAMRTNLNAQTWLDVRAVATVDRFLLQHGYEFRGMSELLRNVVEIVLNTVKIQAPDVIMRDITDAIRYLQARGYSMGQIENSKRHLKKMEVSLQAEAYQSREIERVVGRTYGSTDGPGFQPTEEELAEIAELERAQQKTERDRQRKTCMSPEAFAEIQAAEAKLEAERLGRKAAAKQETAPTATANLVGSDVETIEEAVARRAREAKEQKAKLDEAMAEARRKREEKAKEKENASAEV